MEISSVDAIMSKKERDFVMFKKVITSILAAIMMVGLLAAPVMAATMDSVVVIGADNTQEQINTVYNIFKITRGDVQELTVTNAEERQYLAGIVPESKIGNVALSCVYIEKKDSEGIDISINNINWVTEEMYRSALATAGVKDANVTVAAYKPVSGTGALTGIYKAYETMTGEKLDQSAKEVAAEELVVTGELQEALGNVSSDIVNDIKARLKETKNMNDDQIRQLIRDTAKKYNEELTEDQVEKILELVKKINELNIDPDTFLKVAQAGDSAKTFFTKVGDFFKGVGDFFANLFK